MYNTLFGNCLKYILLIIILNRRKFSDEKLKKFFEVFFLTVISLTMLIARGWTKVSAEGSVKIFLNVLLKKSVSFF